MRSFTHACGTHTRAVSLSLALLLSLSLLCRPVLSCETDVVHVFCPLPPRQRQKVLQRKRGKESEKGREQIQFIFNIIFIVAAARDAEPKESNRAELNRTGRGTNRSQFGMQCAMRLKVFLLLLPLLLLRLPPLLHFVVSSAVPAKLLFLMASS